MPRNISIRAPCRLVGFGSEDHEQGKTDQKNGKYPLEEFPGNRGGCERTENSARNRHRRKGQSGFVINPLHLRIGRGAGKGVEKNDGKRYGRQVMGVLMRIKKEQQGAAQIRYRPR
jgi:hypothetical protein